MRPPWGVDAATWWRRIAPRLEPTALERELLAAALLGERTPSDGILRRIISRERISPRDAHEQRILANVMLAHPAGDHLPVPLRISLVRTCARMPWPELAHCAQSTLGCTDAELDRLLAEAGATVIDRLSVWGLTST